MCRLKHIGTGRYLSVSPLDRRELVLRDTSESQDTLFVLRRDLFRPPSETKGSTSKHGGGLESGVNPHDHVIIETYHKRYVHISQTIKEEFDFESKDHAIAN